MKTTLSAAALVAALALGSPAFAQPSGGPDAKGNAPLKHAHTVDDGAAKHGHTSFTEGQARRHIEKAGFSGVTHLTKGDDGVWRGQAMRGGQTLDVAMDFKGNVSTGGAAPAPAAAMSAPAAPAAPPAAAPSTSTSASTSTSTSATAAATAHPAHRHHRRRHRHHVSCANPSPNGAACSGVDKNRNGISDKEDHAIQNGARP